MGELRFEHLEAGPGQVVKDLLRVGLAQLPVILMCGLREGPALLLTAGIHGSEYNAILAALDVAVGTGADASGLCGSLAVLPVVDTAAFRDRVAYVCPLDNRNANRVFPGSPTGTASEQLAHVITRNMNRFDYLIDLHCGDLVEDVSPYAACVESGRADVDEASMRMARSFGFPLVVLGPGIAGSLTSTAGKGGIPAVMAESGGRGAAETESVRLLSKGVKRAMKSVGLLPGSPEVLASDPASVPAPAATEPSESTGPTVMRGMEVVSSRSDGVFVSRVKTGQWVQKGDVAGQVQTWLGDVRENVLCPFTGVCFLVRSSPPVVAGDLLLVVATASE